MSHKSNSAQSRVIKKKLDVIKRLEKAYWNEIDEQRKKLTDVDIDFESIFQDNFPKEQSSLIYGCVDGAILIRHTENKIPNVIEIKTVDMTLDKFSKELPIPYRKGGMINFGSIGKIEPGGSLRIGKLNIESEGIELYNLQIAVFKYNDEKYMKQWEDALFDVKLLILGLNFNIPRNIYMNQENVKQNLIEKLTEQKNIFDNLLNTSTDEEEIQKYLKANPNIIQPFSNVYAKKKLGDDFITDFVFANTLDQGIIYTFVEIEKANMPIFTKDRDFTKEFNHAEKQTLDWDLWLEKNIAYLKTKLPGLEKPNFLIIAGRSNKFDDDNRALLRAWNRRRSNAEFLTYDDVLQKFGELISNLQTVQNNH
jgi:hypothetical protein